MSGGTVRVCHVITRLDLGGAQENTLYTVGHLRAPFAASLVCGRGGLLDDEASGLPGVPVTFLPSLVRPVRPWRDLRALRDLARLFRSERPQVVHTHSSKAGILGRAAARLAGVPVVVHTIHGFGFNDLQPAPLRAALVALERAASRFTTQFIAVSRANLEKGMALGIVPRGRVRLIRSGIPIAAFETAGRDEALRSGIALRREIGLPRDAPLVGMVACLKRQKDPLTFVEAMARVAAALPRAAFVVAGDGELRAAVQARCEARGLAGKLRLLGWRRDIPGVMAALDVLVLASLWEGLPKVLPQAIAAGVPIVATAVDGTRDVLRDGVSGLLCAPGDAATIASGVIRLLNDPILGRTLAGRARAVLPEFDIDAMVRAQEDLYLELLGAAGCRDAAPRGNQAGAPEKALAVKH